MLDRGRVGKPLRRKRPRATDHQHFLPLRKNTDQLSSVQLSFVPFPSEEAGQRSTIYIEKAYVLQPATREVTPPALPPGAKRLLLIVGGGRRGEIKRCTRPYPPPVLDRSRRQLVPHERPPCRTAAVHDQDLTPSILPRQTLTHERVILEALDGFDPS